MTSTEAWHCLQLPNGESPLIVCEREDLLGQIEVLMEVLEMALTAIAVMHPDPIDQEWVTTKVKPTIVKALALDTSRQGVLERAKARRAKQAGDPA
jgi:hypothetical protein